jgi:hypothetical protein
VSFIEYRRDIVKKPIVYLSAVSKTFSTLHIQHALLHVTIWYIFVFVFYI